MGLQSEDFLLELMYNNPTSGRIEGVTTRLSLELAPAGERDVVLYPHMMSVFNQPDGGGHWGYYVKARSEDRKLRLYDVQNDLTIHHCSFHLHEHAQRIRLRNLTTEETICDVKPEYRKHTMVRVPQVSLPKGITVHKQDVLELIVDYKNPLDKPVDTMGAAIVFGRCPNAAPDCEVIAQRAADNADFDAKLYYSLIGQGAPSQHHHH